MLAPSFSHGEVHRRPAVAGIGLVDIIERWTARRDAEEGIDGEGDVSTVPANTPLRRARPRRVRILHRIHHPQTACCEGPAAAPSRLVALGLCMPCSIKGDHGSFSGNESECRDHVSLFLITGFSGNIGGVSEQASSVGVSSDSSASNGPSLAIVAAICAAEIFGLAGYSIIPALLPQFIEAWSLTDTQAGWLAGSVSAGYMLAVIPLVGSTDRWPARHIYLAASMLGALSCFGMTLCDSLLPALGLRALAGIAMAGMYMPGLRALTHGVGGILRARIAAWYTSSFTIGASLSFLFGRVGTLLGWRSAFVVAGILGVAGVLLASAALPRGEPASATDPQPLLEFRPVLANRDALVLIVGYAATIWGCVGMRQWIVVFLTFCAGDRADIPGQASIILVVGALISFLGVPAGLLGNELAIRYGLRRIVILVFLLSALTGGLFGFAAMVPFIFVLGLSVVVGSIVQGNFSNLTSGVLAVAAPRYRGATIGLYSCIGFGAGFLGTLLFGVTLDRFGGTSHLAAWISSFGTCGLACMTGAAATMFLRRDVWQRPL
jgi:predicted MFS family arabinose efflux permease